MTSRVETPPAADEVEISLFGPGVGECVLVHTGAGEWIVVDSCLDGSTRTSEPVAIRYLTQLGVDIATAVRLVVVTHWHDDHIRGIAEVFRRAKAADIALSVALNSQQFFEITRTAKAQAGMSNPSSVDEFSAVVSELVQRLPPNTRLKVGTPTWAIARLPLHREGASGHVTALSPSQVAFTKANVALCERLQSLVSTGRRLVTQGPNDTAIVLWVQAGTRKILLGSDLETCADPRDGWRRIVTEAVGCRSDAEVFKVAHHGSANGHEPGVWTDMLGSSRFAILTPYRPSRLPKKSDLQRISSQTSEVFLTADVASPRPKKRSTAVENQLNAFTQRRRGVRSGKPGHVRLRMHRDGGPVGVELFDGAKRVG